jgi:hypothetical protein
MAPLREILADDLQGKGVTPLPDVPGLPAGEMKYKFEQLVREAVIPIFNQNVEATYSKNEVDAAIDEKVTEISSADMAKAAYDPGGNVQAAGGIPGYVAADLQGYALSKNVYDPAGEVAAAGGIPGYVCAADVYDPAEDGAHPVASAGGIPGYVAMRIGDNTPETVGTVPTNYALKYPDGRLECFASNTFAVAATGWTAYGTEYYLALATAGDWAAPFVVKPYCFITINGISASMVNPTWSESASGNCYAVSPVANAGNCTVYKHAVGRWK